MDQVQSSQSRKEPDVVWSWLWNLGQETELVQTDLTASANGEILLHCSHQFALNLVTAHSLAWMKSYTICSLNMIH